MSNLHISADLGVINGNYNIGLSLVKFKEDNVTIIYSPALDLSGYGYSDIEALKEFFIYTLNKKTLNKVLKELGWSIKDFLNWI